MKVDTDAYNSAMRINRKFIEKNPEYDVSGFMKFFKCNEIKRFKVRLIIGYKIKGINFFVYKNFGNIIKKDLNETEENQIFLASCRTWYSEKKRNKKIISINEGEEKKEIEYDYCFLIHPKDYEKDVGKLKLMKDFK